MRLSHPGASTRATGGEIRAILERAHRMPKLRFVADNVEVRRNLRAESPVEKLAYCTNCTNRVHGRLPGNGDGDRNVRENLLGISLVDASSSSHSQIATHLTSNMKKNSLSFSFSFTRLLGFSLFFSSRRKGLAHARNRCAKRDDTTTSTAATMTEDHVRYKSKTTSRVRRARTRARVEMTASLIIRVGCREEPFWRLGSARHDDAPPASYCSPSSHRLSLRATRGRRLSLSVCPSHLDSLSPTRGVYTVRPCKSTIASRCTPFMH